MQREREREREASAVTVTNNLAMFACRQADRPMSDQ